MALDKELYRRAYAAIGQWKEAERIEQLQHASRLSPREAWQRYVALWEFCMKLSPPLTELQHKQRFAEWDHYYVQIQKLEAWRRRRGSTT